MDDNDLKVLRTVAALQEREEEATREAVASETGLSTATAEGLLERLMHESLVMAKPITSWVEGSDATPHVKAYSITQKGTDALA